MYKTDHDVISGALREFNEETLQIFDPITIENIKNCPVVYDPNNLIIFIHIGVNPNDVCKVFNDKYKDLIKQNKQEPEVCGITWLTWEEFQHIIKTRGILYYRVRRFLNRADDFSYLL